MVKQRKTLGCAAKQRPPKNIFESKNMYAPSNLDQTCYLTKLFVESPSCIFLHQQRHRFNKEFSCKKLQRVFQVSQVSSALDSHCFPSVLVHVSIPLRFSHFPKSVRWLSCGNQSCFGNNLKFLSELERCFLVKSQNCFSAKANAAPPSQNVPQS